MGILSRRNREFDRFTRVFTRRCQQAWDANQRIMCVTLPVGLWPGLNTLRDPVTGRDVPVHRVPLFTIADANATTWDGQPLLDDRRTVS